MIRNLLQRSEGLHGTSEVVLGDWSERNQISGLYWLTLEWLKERAVYWNATSMVDQMFLFLVFARQETIIKISCYNFSGETIGSSLFPLHISTQL